MAFYSDEWVVQKTIHQIFFGGGCSCCGLGSPSIDLSKYINMCTDASDPDLQAEKMESAEVESPWPYFVKEEVWKDRVKFRSNLKKKRKEIAQAMEEKGEEIRRVWKSLDDHRRCSLCSVPVSCLHHYAINTFDRAYQTVIVLVITQVLKFPLTSYDDDGVAKDELWFETSLQPHHGEDSKEVFRVVETVVKSEINSIGPQGKPFTPQAKRAKRGK
ncbi:hypothetical protein AAMO2058_001664400 [Amorphochlora amoebiformis]